MASLIRTIFQFPQLRFTYRPLASGFSTPVRSPSPTFDKPRPSIFLRWAIEPGSCFAWPLLPQYTLNYFLGSALKLLLLPIILYANWELVSPYVKTDTLNPFGNFFLLSGLVPDSKPDDPRYQKTYWDLGFLAYHVVFFSFVRQSLLFYLSRPLAKYFGLKRESKVDRFGEQTYALLYFLTMGLWGFVSVFCAVCYCQALLTLPQLHYEGQLYEKIRQCQ